MKFDSHMVFGLIVLGVTGVLVVLGKLPASEWTSIAQVIIITLVGGNAITHTATQLANRGLPTATATDRSDQP